MNVAITKSWPKSVWRAAGLLWIAILVAGCGAAPAGSFQPAARQSALTFAFPDDSANARAATEAIAAYTAANPNVQVTALPLAAKDYTQQLLDSLAGGAPDLFVGADAQAPALIKRNAALDLRSLLAGRASPQLGEFLPAALAVWQRGEALYGLPTDVSPQVMFYNRDLFDTAGVAYPAAGWIWDDWLAKAKQLTNTSAGQPPRYGTALGTWANMVWGNGGELLSADGTSTLLDQPAAAAGVQFAADMINVHKVAPMPKDAGGPDPVQLFQKQQVAMMPGSSALAGSLLAAKLPFKWAIAPLPVGKTPASPLSVAGLLISARSQNAPAALDFAAWMAGPAGSAVKAAIMPFAAPALRTASPRTAQIEGADAIPQALAHGRTLPQAAAWPAAKALIDQALVPVWQGQLSASAAYRSVAPKVNALLKVG